MTMTKSPRHDPVGAAAAFLLGLALLLGIPGGAAAQSADPGRLAGSWQSPFSVSGWLGFSLDMAATGNPARPLRATGFIARDRLFDSSCARIPARDRWAAGVCEAVAKDGLVPLDVALAAVPGGAFEGREPRTGGIFRISHSTGPHGPVVLAVTRTRDDGSLESHSFPPLVAWPAAPAPATLAGEWAGEVNGLSVEARLSAVGPDGLSAELRYFPDGEGKAPGRVLGGLGEVAAKERPFAMMADLRRTPGTGRNAAFAGFANHLPGEWQIDHSHVIEVRRLTNAALEIAVARTRGDLVSMRTETLLMRPLGRDLRPVPPVPSPFAGMSGRWSGAMGPLTVELDIEVPGDGALKGLVNHFDDGDAGFPADAPRGFAWAYEVADKRRPFGAFLAGEAAGGAPAITGRVDTEDQGDIFWSTAFRLRNGGDGRLLLDYSEPGRPVAFSGPPIVLSPLGRALREVEMPLAAPPPSGLAGSWLWYSGPGRTGNHILIDLEGGPGGALDGRIQGWNVGGGCERFARTNGVCELARDHGPFQNAIRLAPTGDPRFTHGGAHGIRAFAGALPAYGDLRIRAGLSPDGRQLLVQMTAAEDFGLAPEGTYVFERADRAAAGAPLARDAAERTYVARPDDAIGGGACEAWAKDDSLRRQAGDEAVRAALDAILARQSISVSGHPMDRQCKAMLDEMAALGDADPADPAPAPAPAADPLTVGEGELWRGAYWVFGRGSSRDHLNSFDKLAEFELAEEVFELRATLGGEGLLLAPPDGTRSFADEPRPVFSFGAMKHDGRSFAESFDTVFDDLKGRFTSMPGASTRLRLPYPDGVLMRDVVGDDAILWLGRYRFAYVSTDGTRMVVGHEADTGIYRYFLLDRVR